MLLSLFLISYVSLVRSQNNSTITNSTVTSNLSYVVPFEPNTSRLYQTLYIAVPLLDDYIPPFPYNESTIAQQEVNANGTTSNSTYGLDLQYNMTINSNLYNWTQNQITIQESQNKFRLNLMKATKPNTLDWGSYNQDYFNWMDRYSSAMNGVYYNDRDIKFTVAGILLNKLYVLDANKTNINQDQGNINLYSFGKKVWQIINQDKQCYQVIWDQLRVIAQGELIEQLYQGQLTTQTYLATLPPPQILTPIIYWDNTTGITQQTTETSNCSNVSLTNPLCFTNTVIVYNIFTPACLLDSTPSSCQNYTLNETIYETQPPCAISSTKNCQYISYLNTTSINSIALSSQTIVNNVYDINYTTTNGNPYTLANITTQESATLNQNGQWTNSTYIYNTVTFYQKNSNPNKVNLNINSTISANVLNNIIKSTNYTVTTTNTSTCQSSNPYTQPSCSFTEEIINITDVCSTGISNCVQNIYDDTKIVTHTLDVNTCTSNDTCQISTTDVVNINNCINAPVGKLTGCIHSTYTINNITNVTVIPTAQVANTLQSTTQGTSSITTQYKIVNTDNSSITTTNIQIITLQTQITNCTNLTNPWIENCASTFTKIYTQQNCPDGNLQNCSDVLRTSDLEIFNNSNTTNQCLTNTQLNSTQCLTYIEQSKQIYHSVNNVIATAMVYYDIKKNITANKTTCVGTKLENCTKTTINNGSICVIDFDTKSTCEFDEFYTQDNVTDFELLEFYNGTDKTTANTFDSVVLAAFVNPSYQETVVIIKTTGHTTSEVSKRCYGSYDNSTNCTADGSANTQTSNNIDTTVTGLNFDKVTGSQNINSTTLHTDNSNLHNNVNLLTTIDSRNITNTINKQYSKILVNFDSHLTLNQSNSDKLLTTSVQNASSNITNVTSSTSSFTLTGKTDTVNSLTKIINCAGNCITSTLSTSNVTTYKNQNQKLNSNSQIDTTYDPSIINATNTSTTNATNLDLTQITDFKNENKNDYSSDQSKNNLINNCITTSQTINQSQDCNPPFLTCTINLQIFISNITCNNYVINRTFISSQNWSKTINNTCINGACGTTTKILTNYSSRTLDVIDARCQLTKDNRTNCTNQTLDTQYRNDTLDWVVNKTQIETTYSLQNFVYCLDTNGIQKNCTFNVFNTSNTTQCTNSVCSSPVIWKTKTQQHCVGNNVTSNCQYIPNVYIDYNICPNKFYQSNFDPRLDLVQIDAQIHTQLNSPTHNDEYLKILVEAQLGQKLKDQNDLQQPLDQIQIQQLNLVDNLQINETNMSKQMDYLFGEGNASVLLSENDYFSSIQNIHLPNHENLGRVFDLNLPNVTFKWELKDIYLINISQFFPIGIQTEISRAIKNTITEPPEGWSCRKALIYEQLMGTQNQSFNISQLKNQNLNTSLSQNTTQIDFVLDREDDFSQMQPGLPNLKDQLVEDQIQNYKTNINRLLVQNPLDNYTNLQQDQIYLSISKSIKSKFKVLQSSPLFTTIYYTLGMQLQKSQNLQFTAQTLQRAFNDSNFMYVGTFQCYITGLQNTSIQAVQPFMFRTPPTLQLNKSIVIQIIDNQNQTVDLTNLIREDIPLTVQIQDSTVTQTSPFNGTVYVGQYTQGLFNSNTTLTTLDNISYPLIFPTIKGQDIYVVLALKRDGNFNYQLIKLNTSNPFFSCADYYLPSTTINLTDINLNSLDNVKLKAITVQLMIDATSNSQLIQTQLKSAPIPTLTDVPVIKYCGFNDSCNNNGQCINFTAAPIMNCSCNATFLLPFCSSNDSIIHTIELANIMVNQINSSNVGQQVTAISALLQNEVNNTVLIKALDVINSSQSSFNNQTQNINGIQALSDIKNTIESQGNFTTSERKQNFTVIRQIQKNFIWNLTKSNFTNNGTPANFSIRDTSIVLQSLYMNNSNATNGTTVRILQSTNTSNTTNTTNTTTTNTTTNSTNSTNQSTCDNSSVFIQSNSIYYGGFVIQGTNLTFNTCTQASQKQYLVSITTQTLDYYKYEIDTSKFATQIVQIDFYNKNFTKVTLDQGDTFNLSIGVSKLPGTVQFIRGVQLIQNGETFTLGILDRSQCTSITVDPPVAIFTLTQSGLYAAVIEDEGFSPVPPQYVSVNDTSANTTDENYLEDQTTFQNILVLGMFGLILMISLA